MNPKEQQDRKKAYRERSGPVSNPGYPAKNRKVQRAAYYAAWDEALSMNP